MQQHSPLQIDVYDVDGTIIGQITREELHEVSTGLNGLWELQLEYIKRYKTDPRWGKEMGGMYASWWYFTQYKPLIEKYGKEKAKTMMQL